MKQGVQQGCRVGRRMSNQGAGPGPEWPADANLVAFDTDLQPLHLETLLRLIWRQHAPDTAVLTEAPNGGQLLEQMGPVCYERNTYVPIVVSQPGIDTQCQAGSYRC